MDGTQTIEELCSGLELAEKQLSRAFGITMAQLRVLKRAEEISYTTQAGRRLKAAHNLMTEGLRKGKQVHKIKTEIEEALNKFVLLEDEQVAF